MFALLLHVSPNLFLYKKKNVRSFWMFPCQIESSSLQLCVRHTLVIQIYLLRPSFSLISHFLFPVLNCIAIYHVLFTYFTSSTLFFCCKQACHTKAKYEEYGASICRTNPIFKGMYWYDFHSSWWLGSHFSCQLLENIAYAFMYFYRLDCRRLCRIGFRSDLCSWEELAWLDWIVGTVDYRLILGIQLGWSLKWWKFCFQG